MRSMFVHVTDLRNEHFVMGSMYGISAVAHETLIATLLVSLAYALVFFFQMLEVHKEHPHLHRCPS